MANQRQREARKRFKEANPDQFTQQQQQQPASEKSNKKIRRKPKSFKKHSKDPNDPRRKRHPLRVPGMKPGESCFICKAFDHIAKLCPQKAEWSRHKICLLCRQRGHTVRNCTNNGDGSMDKKFCYNCGETGHALHNCPQPLQDGGTKFASCFICKEKGHLSKECPKNTHGIYPKGGCCKVCGGVTHLAKDCPNKYKRDSISFQSSNTFGGERRSQVTKFISGDDLDDDFMTDDTHDVKKEESSAKPEKQKKHGENQKQKNGPKVVNFS